MDIYPIGTCYNNTNKYKRSSVPITFKGMPKRTFDFYIDNCLDILLKRLCKDAANDNKSVNTEYARYAINTAQSIKINLKRFMSGCNKHTTVDIEGAGIDNRLQLTFWNNYLPNSINIGNKRVERKLNLTPNGISMPARLQGDISRIDFLSQLDGYIKWFTQNVKPNDIDKQLLEVAKEKVCKNAANISILGKIKRHILVIRTRFFEKAIGH